jgi:hypothetical protein
LKLVSHNSARVISSTPVPVVIHSFTSGFTDIVLPDFDREYHRLGTRFDSNSIIDRRLNSLFTAQVAFRRLNGNMTQKELDLFQLSSRGVAEAGACAAQIMPIMLLFQLPAPTTVRKCL